MEWVFTHMCLSFMSLRLTIAYIGKLFTCINHINIYIAIFRRQNCISKISEFRHATTYLTEEVPSYRAILEALILDNRRPRQYGLATESSLLMNQLGHRQILC